MHYESLKVVRRAFFSSLLSMMLPLVYSNCLVNFQIELLSFSTTVIKTQHQDMTLSEKPYRKKAHLCPLLAFFYYSFVFDISVLTPFNFCCHEPSNVLFPAHITSELVVGSLL